MPTAEPVNTVTDPLSLAPTPDSRRIWVQEHVFVRYAQEEFTGLVRILGFGDGFKLVSTVVWDPRWGKWRLTLAVEGSGGLGQGVTSHVADGGCLDCVKVTARYMALMLVLEIQGRMLLDAKGA